MTASILSVATDYLTKGFAIVPVPYKSKVPAIKNWPKLKITPSNVQEYFDGNPSNIAALLGTSDGRLIDVDLDCQEALALADHLLPPTEYVFGRESRPSSHFFYASDGKPPKTMKFNDVDGTCLLELRSTGTQTLIPPSVHPSGEILSFVKNGTPALLPADKLVRHLILLGCACLLVRHWPAKGNRHHIALASAGVLARANYTLEEIEAALLWTAKAAGDEEPEDRKKAAASTLEKLASGKPATGMPTVSAILGEEVAKKLGEWLGQNAKTDTDAHVAELNRRHAVLILGGNCLVLNEETDPISGRPIFPLSSFADFKKRYSNRKVQVGLNAQGQPKFLPLGQVWLDHKCRRQYKGLVFSPEKECAGYYNSWQGFAVTPAPGDCQQYLDHILANVCAGNKEHYCWLLAWMADAVQHPENRPGTAIAMRGKQGTGKTIACSIFGNLFGNHYLSVSHPRLLYGNFNSHLQNCLILSADDAFWAGDKQAEGVLKDLVTGDTLNIERKGVDVQTTRNIIRVMIASNQNWVVPAGLEERRFFVLDVAETHMQDKPYFAAIIDQMNDGGREALLHFLQHHDYSDVDLRTVPQTKALWEQKLYSMGPIDKFWFELLCDGDANADDQGWPAFIRTKTLMDFYYQAAGKAGHGHKGWKTEFGQRLKKLCPDIEKKRKMLPVLDHQGHSIGGSAQQSVYILPDLATCRLLFDEATNTDHLWPNDGKSSD